MKTIDVRPEDLEQVLADVREAFRESDLPFKVDVVDRATTRDSFRRIIEQEFVVVLEEGVSAARST